MSTLRIAQGNDRHRSRPVARAVRLAGGDRPRRIGAARDTPALRMARAGWREQGQEIWMDLGLQSAHDATQQRAGQGYGLAAYADADRAAWCDSATTSRLAIAHDLARRGGLGAITSSPWALASFSPPRGDSP